MNKYNTSPFFLVLRSLILFIDFTNQEKVHNSTRTDLSNCKITHSGTEYQGQKKTTAGNVRCQSWNSEDPIHKVSSEIEDDDFPERSMKLAKNYCRNPTKDPKGPWCYTMEPTLINDECGIPLCNYGECRISGTGAEYGGSKKKSVAGRKCKSWDKHYKLKKGQSPKFSSNKFPEFSREKAKNFCRNPNDDEGGPWCYVEEEDFETVEKEYCDIPFCDDKDCLVYVRNASVYSTITKLNETYGNITLWIKLWNPSDEKHAEARFLLSLLPIPTSSKKIAQDWRAGVEILISNAGSGQVYPSSEDEQDLEETLNIIVGTKWTGIWINWGGGFISVGLYGSTKPLFMDEYRKKNTISSLYGDSFFYYGLMGTGVLWSTDFCQEACEVHTTFGEEYLRVWPLQPSNTTYDVRFNVRASKDISVRLYQSPGSLFPCFTITIGVANTITIVYQESEKSSKQHLKDAPGENLLDFWAWKEFTVSIFGPHLRLFSQLIYGYEEIIYLKDHLFGTIRWFSVGSRNNIAKWTFFCIPESDPVEKPSPPNCITNLEDFQYEGSQWTTINEMPCVPWISNEIPDDDKKDDSFIDRSAKNATNKCRNPGHDPKGPYCYSMSLENVLTTSKQYCPIRTCRSLECRMAGTGNDYVGTLSVTRTGRTCAKWMSDYDYERLSTQKNSTWKIIDKINELTNIRGEKLKDKQSTQKPEKTSTNIVENVKSTENVTTEEVSTVNMDTSTGNTDVNTQINVSNTEMSTNSTVGLNGKSTRISKTSTYVSTASTELNTSPVNTEESTASSELTTSQTNTEINTASVELNATSTVNTESNTTSVVSTEAITATTEPNTNITSTESTETSTASTEINTTNTVSSEAIIITTELNTTVTESSEGSTTNTEIDTINTAVTTAESTMNEEENTKLTMSTVTTEASTEVKTGTMITEWSTTNTEIDTTNTEADTAKSTLIEEQSTELNTASTVNTAASTESSTPNTESSASTETSTSNTESSTVDATSNQKIVQKSFPKDSNPKRMKRSVTLSSTDLNKNNFPSSLKTENYKNNSSKTEKDSYTDSNTRKAIKNKKFKQFEKPIHSVNPEYFNDTLYPEHSVINASNYCRDPSRNIAGTWCYTTDPLVPQDLCDVRDCDMPEECTFFVKGVGSGRRLFVLPEHRAEGLHFSLKAWEPDQPDSITFVFTADDGFKSRYILKVGALDNEKVILYYQSEEENIKMVKKKTLPHLIYHGKWSSFVLKIPRGHVMVYYEGAPNPLFQWDHPDPPNAFLPIYYYYTSEHGHTIGVAFDCTTRCHIENTRTDRFSRILPLSIWSQKSTSTPDRIQLMIRAEGVVQIPLLLFPGTSGYYAITLGQQRQWIFFLKNTYPRVQIFHRQKAPSSLFTANSWTNITMMWSNRIIRIFWNETQVFYYEHTHPLLFYYFSLAVDPGGWATWAANCIPADIDGDPEDGGWSEWGPWACSVSCNGGVGTRKRVCDNPKPNVKGEPCLGPNVMSGRCNTIICGDVTDDTVNLIKRRIRGNYTALSVKEGDEIRIPSDPDIIKSITNDSPDSEIEWSHNGIFLHSKNDRLQIKNYDIVIKKARTNDSGVYTITLHRVDGTHMIFKMATLVVYPIKSIITIRETLPITVICHSVILGYLYSDLKISWTINNKLWKNYGTTLPITVNVDIVPALNKSHKGLWECIVQQDDLGFKWTTNAIYVDVIGPPNWRTHLMEDEFTKPIFGWMPNETFVAVSALIIFLILTTCIIVATGYYRKFQLEREKGKPVKKKKDSVSKKIGTTEQELKMKNLKAIGIEKSDNRSKKDKLKKLSKPRKWKKYLSKKKEKKVESQKLIADTETEESS